MSIFQDTRCVIYIAFQLKFNIIKINYGCLVARVYKAMPQFVVKLRIQILKEAVWILRGM